MTLALGIFDIFAYAIPGSLYLLLGAYVAARLGWVDFGALTTSPSIILVTAVIIASYLTGHLTYALGTAVDRVLPFWRKSMADARREFVHRVPAAAERPYVQANAGLLLAVAEIHDREAATGISRLRAVGLMVRNCGTPLMLAVVVAVTEALVGPHRPAAIVSAVLLLGGALAGIRQNQRLRHWANLKTLEICYCVPDIDELVLPRQPQPRRRGWSASLRRRR